MQTERTSPSPLLSRWRRAQMEIMGLTIIVLLVSIGILFALGIISKPVDDIKKGYEQKQLAVNFLSTLLDTTSGCQLNTFRQLLMDCATDRIVICPGGLDSCSYTKTQFTTIFRKTLDPLRKGYYLNLDGPSAVKVITQGSFGTSGSPTPCPGERDQATQPIPTLGGGTIIAKLEICDRTTIPAAALPIGSGESDLESGSSPSPTAPAPSPFPDIIIDGTTQTMTGTLGPLHLLLIKNNGVLRVAPRSSGSSGMLHIIAEQVILDQGRIAADGAGYLPLPLNLSGDCSIVPTPPGCGGGGGAGHATTGAPGSAGAAGGISYGIPTLSQGFELGSAGGNGAGLHPGAGGSGGGSVSIEADTVSLEHGSKIMAHGSPGMPPTQSGSYGGGGGSGGSIRIKARTTILDSTSSVVAIGGAGSSTHGGAGAAGRIYIEGSLSGGSIAPAAVRG